MRLAILLLLLSSLAFPAYIHGEIYSPGLEKINQTLVQVEGKFSYQVVTDKANYSFFLPEGDYRISASNFDENGNLMLYTEQEISVGNEDQNIDLVLKPKSYLEYAIIAVIVLLFASIYVIMEKFRPKQVPQKQELDGDAKKVLQVLDSYEGRATQKEVLEATNFSNSKLSLILTELESMGKIKKFKRGRGNIIKKL